MQLFHSPASPFVRKVMTVLHETDQLDDVELIPFSGTALAPLDVLNAQNPLGKIPTLIRNDGAALFDSRVICRFLNERAKANLYPEERLWEVLSLESLADGIMEAAVLMVYEGRLRPEAQQSPEWVEAQWQKASRGLDVLNERWMSHLAGPLDMGQIAVGVALGYIDFRHPDRNWRNGRDGLKAWEAEFSQRASMQATAPQ